MKTVTFVLVAMLIGVGCDKKEATPGATPEKAPAAVKDAPKPATTPAALVQPAAEEDIPTTADFEDEADKDIDKATVETEVDKLAKEIGE